MVRQGFAVCCLGNFMDSIPDFQSFEFTAEEKTKLVFFKGNGPAVLLMHELPGMTPECVALARRIAHDGFTVYMPLLFGEANEPLSGVKMLGNAVKLCLSREFAMLASHRSSPVTSWLKALCREAKARCEGPGVGVIGMCLTGGFVLSLMADDSVLTPVMCQPSLPVALLPQQKRALGLSADELAIAKQRAASGCKPLGFRFSGDSTCPAERFTRLRQEFGDRIDLTEIDSSPGNEHGFSKRAHAVLTVEFVDQPGHPTRAVLDKILQRLHQNLDGTQPA